MTELLRFPLPDNLGLLEDWALFTGGTMLRRGTEYYEELGILVVDGTDFPAGLRLQRTGGLTNVADILASPGEVLQLLPPSEAYLSSQHNGNPLNVVEVLQSDGVAYYRGGFLVTKDPHPASEVLKAFGFELSRVFAIRTSGEIQRLEDLVAAEKREHEFEFQQWLETSRK